MIKLTLGLTLGGWGRAQRYHPGRKGIQITTGAVDGFTLSNKDSQAFNFELALSTYTKSNDRWVWGAEFLQKKHEYKDILIPASQITAEGGYYHNFLSDRSKTVFFSFGFSILGGYETINWGKTLLYDGATITSKDTFLYGGAVSFAIELYLSDRMVLLFNVRERFLPSSSVQDFHFQYGLGLKFIIN